MNNKILKPEKFGSMVVEKLGMPYLTKGYRRAGSAEEALNSPIDLNAEDCPHITGIILYDGDTYGIEEFFSLRILKFGESSGKNIEIVDIGDPMQHDNIYGKKLTQDQANDVKSLAEQYRKLVAVYGSERHLKILHQQFLIEITKVDRDYLPCILFIIDQDYGRILFFIKHKWYDYKETARIFSKELQSFFEGLDWQELFSNNVTKAILHQRFNNKLREWERCLDERIGDSLLMGGSSARQEYYCKIFKHDSVIYISQIEYNELLDAKTDFDLFIDGFTLNFLRNNNKGLSDPASLTHSEFRMLIDIIKKGDFIEIKKIRAKDDQSYEAAHQMFKRLRKKIDTKLDGDKYQIFKHCLTENTNKTGYKFDPPVDLKYCIILPV